MKNAFENQIQECLNGEEKLKLANFFLSQADLLMREGQKEEFLFALRNVTELMPSSFAIMRRLGSLYCDWAVLHGEEAFFGHALTFFQKAKSLINEGLDSRLEMGLLYWDWGNAWVSLGKTSKEISDLKEGVKKFQKASLLGCNELYFHIEYAHCLHQIGSMEGDPKPLLLAMELLKKVVSRCFSIGEDKKPRLVLKKAWYELVSTAQLCAQITGKESDLRVANQLFHEAIVAEPSLATLWLKWAELHLFFGWIHKDISSIESALEKLTSSKIGECNSLDVATALGEGLILLGLFIDDFQLLKEGQSRVLDAIDHAPNNPSALFGAGLASLALGLYFSDSQMLLEAIDFFKKGITESSGSIKLLQGLFQAYIALGVITKSEKAFARALATIARIVELSPYCCYFWSQWVDALLKRYHLGKQDSSFLKAALEKCAKARQISEGSLDERIYFQEACAWLHLADHEMQDDYYEKAKSILWGLLEKVPDAAHVRLCLGIVCAHQGRFNNDTQILYQAHDHFQGLIKPSEEDATAWAEWGSLLLHLSECVRDPFHPEEAERLHSLAEAKLLRAIELGFTDAYYLLACLYALVGLKELALSALHKASEFNALPSKEAMLGDKRLKSIWQLADFQEFLRRCSDE